MATLKDNYNALIEGIMGKTNQELSKTNSEIKKNSDQISSIDATTQKNKNNIEKLSKSVKDMQTGVPISIYELDSNWKDQLPSGVTEEELFLWGANLCGFAAYEWDVEDEYIIKEYSDKFLTTSELYNLLTQTKTLFHVAPEYIEGYDYPNNNPIFFDNKKSTLNKLYFMTNSIYNWYTVEDITDEIDGVSKTFANITYWHHKDTNWGITELIDEGLPGIMVLKATDSLSKAECVDFVYPNQFLELDYDMIKNYETPLKMKGLLFSYNDYVSSSGDITLFYKATYLSNNYIFEDTLTLNDNCSFIGIEYNGDLDEEIEVYGYSKTYQTGITWRHAVNKGYLVYNNNQLLTNLEDLVEGEYYQWYTYQIITYKQSYKEFIEDVDYAGELTNKQPNIKSCNSHITDILDQSTTDYYFNKQYGYAKIAYFEPQFDGSYNIVHEGCIPKAISEPGKATIYEHDPYKYTFSDIPISENQQAINWWNTVYSYDIDELDDYLLSELEGQLSENRMSAFTIPWNTQIEKYGFAKVPYSKYTNSINYYESFRSGKESSSNIPCGPYQILVTYYSGAYDVVFSGNGKNTRGNIPYYFSKKMSWNEIFNNDNITVKTINLYNKPDQTITRKEDLVHAQHYFLIINDFKYDTAIITYMDQQYSVITIYYYIPRIGKYGKTIFERDGNYWIPHHYLYDAKEMLDYLDNKLDLLTVSSTQGTYTYVQKCTVTVDSSGNKTPVYTWELETQ